METITVFLFMMGVLILGTFGISEDAFAKNQKYFDINEKFSSGPTIANGGVCGIAPVEVYSITHVYAKLWSNGKIILHANSNIVITDPNNSDSIVARGSSGSTQNLYVDELPFTNQGNTITTCLGGSGMTNFHCGLTIDKNDRIHAHNLGCEF